MMKSIWVLTSENDDHWAFFTKEKAVDFAQDLIMRWYSYEVSIEDWKNVFTLVEIKLYE